MKRTLKVLSVCLVLSTAAVATAGPLVRGGASPALPASAADVTESLVSAVVRWFIGLWAADTAPPPPTPPGPTTNGPGDNGSCVDPDGRPCREH